MTTITTEEGIEVTIEFDSDGFPTVRIETGGGYAGDNDRPAVEVVLAGTVIHEMFDNKDAAESFDSDMLRTLVEGTENWCDYLEENDRETEIEDEYDPALVYAHDYLRNQ